MFRDFKEFYVVLIYDIFDETAIEFTRALWTLFPDDKFDPNRRNVCIVMGREPTRVHIYDRIRETGIETLHKILRYKKGNPLDGYYVPGSHLSITDND